MKRLILLRHASADNNKFSEENDHDKPLDKRGEADSKNLSEWLKNSFLNFDLIISSNAKRAIQTSELVFTPLGKIFQKNPAFYLCNYEEIILTLKKLDENIHNVVIVGHEPSMSETMRALVGTTRPDLEKKLNSSYYPCTMSFIYFNISNWKSLKEKYGILEGYINPEIINMQNEKY